MQIDIAKLKVEVKFEPPAPIPGAGTSHLEHAILFPHIHGKLNMDAVTGVGKAEKADGKFVWPKNFDDMKKYS